MSGIADNLVAGRGIGDYVKYPWVKESGMNTVEQLCAHWNFDYNQVVALGRLRQENREKYGFPDWCEWCHKNWGTSWNACYVQFTHKPEARIPPWCSIPPGHRRCQSCKSCSAYSRITNLSIRGGKRPTVLAISTSSETARLLNVKNSRFSAGDPIAKTRAPNRLLIM
jgi:hypothetical protein